MINSEQNVQECDATDDAICTRAGYIIFQFITLRHPSINSG